MALQECAGSPKVQKYTVVTEKRNFGNKEHTLVMNVNHNYLMK